MELIKSEDWLVVETVTGFTVVFWDDLADLPSLTEFGLTSIQIALCCCFLPESSSDWNNDCSLTDPMALSA